MDVVDEAGNFRVVAGDYGFVAQYRPLDKKVCFSHGKSCEVPTAFIMIDDDAIDLARWICEQYGVEIVLHPKTTFGSSAIKFKGREV